MSEAPKIFIPLDFRGHKKTSQPFVLTIDTDEEPPCIRMDTFSAGVHISTKMDEPTLDALFDLITGLRLELAKRVSFQKGAANAMRKQDPPP